MIYSRFGTKVTLLSKHDVGGGRLSLQGTAEIDQAIATLPWKTVQKRVRRAL